MIAWLVLDSLIVRLKVCVWLHRLTSQQMERQWLRTSCLTSVDVQETTHCKAGNWNASSMSRRQLAVTKFW